MSVSWKLPTRSGTAAMDGAGAGAEMALAAMAAAVNDGGDRSSAGQTSFQLSHGSSLEARFKVSGP